MSILLENQFHPPPGPIATLFVSLDIHKQGFITKRELHTLVESFCAHHPLSFVQKKLLFMMLNQGFSRCASQKGKLIWSDIMVYAPKLLIFFGQPTDDVQQYQQSTEKRFQKIACTSTLSNPELAQHCSAILPRMCPNKNLLSLFLAHILCLLCTNKATTEITKQMWCDTALSIFFEVNAHR